MSSRRGHITSPFFSNWPPPLTSWAMRFMRCRRAVVERISELPTKWLSPPKKISTSLGLFCPLSCQNEWASRASIQPRPYDGKLAWLSAPGVRRRARMRVQQPTTCGIYITTWASSVPTTWTTSWPVRRPCIDMPISVNQQLVATVRMTGMKRTMRTMTMEMKMMSPCLKRNNLPNQLYTGFNTRAGCSCQAPLAIWTVAATWQFPFYNTSLIMQWSMLCASDQSIHNCTVLVSILLLFYIMW